MSAVTVAGGITGTEAVGGFPGTIPGAFVGGGPGGGPGAFNSSPHGLSLGGGGGPSGTAIALNAASSPAAMALAASCTDRV